MLVNGWSTAEEPNAGAFVAARPAGGTSVAELYAVNTAATAGSVPQGVAANLGTIGDGTKVITAFAVL